MPWHSSMEKHIKSQMQHWVSRSKKINFPQINTQKKEIEEQPEPGQNELPFITVSREYGCHGYGLASMLVERLNKNLNIEPEWAAYDRKLLENLMKDMGLSDRLVRTLSEDAHSSLTHILETTFTKYPSRVAVYRKLVQMISILAANGHVVIVGRGGNYITRSFKKGYHVRLVATRDDRITNIQNTYNMNRLEAAKLVKQKSKKREQYLLKFIKHDIADPHNYHLVINMSQHTIEEATSMIITGLDAKGFLDPDAESCETP